MLPKIWDYSGEKFFFGHEYKTEKYILGTGDNGHIGKCIIG
jgi:hypothetical protein